MPSQKDGCDRSLTRHEFDELAESAGMVGNLDSVHTFYRDGSKSVAVFVPDVHTQRYQLKNMDRILRLDRSISFDAIGVEGFPAGPIKQDYVDAQIQRINEAWRIREARRVDVLSVWEQRSLAEHAIIELQHSAQVRLDKDLLGIHETEQDQRVDLWDEIREKSSTIESNLRRYFSESVYPVAALRAFRAVESCETCPTERAAATRYKAVLNLEALLRLGVIEDRLEDAYARARAHEDMPEVAGLIYAQRHTRALKIGIEDKTSYLPIAQKAAAVIVHNYLSLLDGLREEFAYNIARVTEGYSGSAPEACLRLRGAVDAFINTLREYQRPIMKYANSLSAQARRALLHANISDSSGFMERVVTDFRSQTWVENLRGYHTTLVVGGEAHLPSFARAVGECNTSLIALTKIHT